MLNIVNFVLELRCEQFLCLSKYLTMNGLISNIINYVIIEVFMMRHKIDNIYVSLLFINNNRKRLKLSQNAIGFLPGINLSSVDGHTH